MDSIQRLIREMISDADIIDDEDELWYDDDEAPLSYDEFVALIWKIYKEYAEDPEFEDYSPEYLTDIVEGDLIETLKEKFNTYVCDFKYDNRNGRYYDFDLENATEWYKDYRKQSEKVWKKVYNSFEERFDEQDYETEEERRQSAYDEYMEERGDEDRLYDYD